MSINQFAGMPLIESDRKRHPLAPLEQLEAFVKGFRRAFKASTPVRAGAKEKRFMSRDREAMGRDARGGLPRL